MRTQDSLPPIWRTLSRIQLALQATPEQLAEYMGMTRRELDRIREQQEGPSTSALMQLGNRVDLHFDSIMLGQVDYRALARRWAGANADLPEKYALGAFSRMRTANNVLDYVETHYGPHKRALVLRRMQMNEAAVADAERLVSMRFAIDVARYFYGFHRSSSEIVNMGRFSQVTHSGSPMGKALSSQARNVPELYELLADGLTQSIERNYIWNLDSLDNEGCVISGRPSPDLIHLAGLDYAKSEIACWIRAGFWETVPFYIDAPIASVTETRCVARGDAQCRFRVKFGTSEPSARKLRSA